jgi:5-hydroxyisourate hydrolase-like protein (transthyretin family)
MFDSAAVASVLLALVLPSSTPVTMMSLAARDSRQTTSTQPSRSSEAAGRVRGRVFAADTGKPVAGAIVTLVDMRASNPAERQGRWIRTDAEGRWEAQDLRPGAYTLSVSKAGYLKIEYGQKRPFERGKSIEVVAGQMLDRIDMALPRGGAITGRVFDEFGDPAAAVFVRGLRQRYVDGRRELTPLAEALEGLANGGGDVTDDLGQFRIYGLAPGDYYVSASFNPPGEAATAVGYPPVYYPGTPSAAEARRVRIGLGEEAQNINLTLVSARYAVVSGAVINSLGASASASIQLASADPAVGMPVAPARTASNGTFTLRNVPPGEYRLHVYDVRPAPGAPEFASVPVSIGGEDVTALAVTTAPGATASGRVVFEDGAKVNGRMFVRSVTTVAGAPTFSNTSVGVDPDSTFEMTGLTDRQTFRAGMLPEGWFFKSVMHDGVDITDTGYDFKPGQRVAGIEIHLTRRATTLSGTVQDDRANPVGDYTVVAFSSNPSRWGYQTRFVRSGRPDQGGTFTLRALPPDEYFVVALEYVETGQEFDPEQLANWKALATTVELREGESKTVSLKLSPQ